MVKAGLETRAQAARSPRQRGGLPAVGLTMFGVTTPCVQRIAAALAADWDCLVFHATGGGGRAMGKPVGSRLIVGGIHLPTTEVPRLLLGGGVPAVEDPR